VLGRRGLENNQCRDAAKGECVPTPRDVLCPPGACGLRYDGCSGVVDCGGCAPGLECGGGEHAGMCTDPFAVTPSDVRAMLGASVRGCFADERGNTIVVDCPAGQRCESSQCVGVAIPDSNAPPDLLSPDAAAPAP